MMFANNDFRVDAQITGFAQNFDHSSNRRNATLRKTQQLYIDDCAVKLLHTADATHAPGLHRIASGKLFSKRRGEFLAGRNFHLMLNPSVVGKHEVTARPVAKQSNNRRMRPVEDPHDLAFRSLACRAGRDAAKIDEYVIAMHGVAHCIAGNKNVAIELRHRLIWHHKAITVLMENQATGKRIAPMRSCRRGWRGAGVVLLMALCLAFLAAGRKYEPPVGQLDYRLSFL